MRNFKKISLRLLTFLLCIIVIEGSANALKTGSVKRTLEDMYNQEKNIDCAFVGTSTVMTGCDTAVFDKVLNMNTFNLGTPAQTPMNAYYILREIIKSNHPKMVLLSISPARFYQSDDVMADVIGYNSLRWSLNRAEYFFHAFSFEDYPDALFTTHLYRDRITVESVLSRIPHKSKTEDKSKTSEDITGSGHLAMNEKSVPTGPKYTGKGFFYHYNGNVKGNAGGAWTTDTSKESIKSDEYFNYLKKFSDLCSKNQIELIFFIHPRPVGTVMFDKNAETVYSVVQGFAEDNNLKLYNFELIKPDKFERKDEYYYDTLHLNGIGATVFSNLFADLLLKHAAGGINNEEYFYSSYEELYSDTDHVTNAWIDIVESEGSVLLEGNAIYGKYVIPEYEFLYKKTGEEEWGTINSYSEVSSVTFALEKGTSYIFRVNVRTVGSDAKYEQYFEKKFS